MRKVKIISNVDLPFFSTTKDFEKPLNSVFEEIHEMGGVITNTKYCVSHAGCLEAVIIEYQLPATYRSGGLQESG